MSDADDAALIAAARQSATRAYVPYSHFHVGAAVLTGEGEIFAACNVENASYGLSICAETNAIASAVAAGARSITRIAVVGYPADAPHTSTVATPCGRCRQVMVEFATADATVLLVPADGGAVRTVPVRELLPFAFDATALA